MKVHELVTLIEAPLKLMNEKNISLSSVEYLGMFREYESMKDEGLKKFYIIASLCGKYNIGRTKLLELISCFETEIL